MNNILIIEPSSAGLELLPAAYAMNLRIFVFSANQDERIIPDDFKKYIYALSTLDTYNLSLVYDLANTINQRYPLSAIIPGSEYHVPISAQLSARMKLPGVHADYVDSLRYKNKTRECLENKNVRCPKYMVITNENELKNARESIKFPCVIKPVGSAGSIHVSRANNYNELLCAYGAMCCDRWMELGREIGNVAIIEEYIEGEEFSVEGYIENLQARCISITETFLSPEPLFIKLGHIIPANVNNEKKRLIEAYIQQVITALNINIGVFHAELRFDKEGPVLMEIAGRLPGGRICDLIQLAKGINFSEIMIQSHLGQSIDINRDVLQQFSGIHYFGLDGKDKFNCVNGLDKVQKIPGFKEFKLLIKPGEYVPPVKNFTSLVATCILTAPTYSEVKYRLDSARSLITFA